MDQYVISLHLLLSDMVDTSYDDHKTLVKVSVYMRPQEVMDMARHSSVSLGCHRGASLGPYRGRSGAKTANVTSPVKDRKNATRSAFSRAVRFRGKISLERYGFLRAPLL